jgi:perosamine synthetase
MRLVGLKIPLFKIFWDEDDVLAVNEVIRSGVYWTTGPTVKKFENSIAEYIGTKYAVAFSSGTTALHSAIMAYGIGEGDEIIVPSFSFIATANAALYERAVPVFADIERSTFGLDPESVKEKITKKTKAIIPVHYGGSPCLITELKQIAEDNNLVLIEDAAESLGSGISGRKVGTFGDSAMLSFCQNKVITTGDGGAVVTNSTDVYEKLKLFRSHGRLEPSNYFSSSEIADYVSLGYNYRMSDITAALGVSQLSKVDKVISLRRKNVEYLTGALSEIEEVAVPSVSNNYFHVYQLYTILVESGRLTRDRLLKYLVSRGISTKVYFDPIHLTHFYKSVLGYKCKLPVTEDLSNKVLTLPMYPSLTIEEMDYIAKEIRMFFEKDKDGQN